MRYICAYLLGEFGYKLLHKNYCNEANNILNKQEEKGDRTMSIYKTNK